MAAHSMQYCIALCMIVGIVSAYTPYGDCDNFNAEKTNEGYCKHRYQDSLGIWTIGIGFNMQQSNAQSVLSSCGGDMSSLNAGPNSCSYSGVPSQVISDSVASCLLYHYLSSAETCAKGLLGSKWSSTPNNVKSGMIDMAYNMGCGGLTSFKTMLGHIQNGDYSSASSAAKSTKWCGQVGGRCTRTTKCVGNSGSGSTTTPPPPATGSTATTQGGCSTFRSGLCGGGADCMCKVSDTCSASYKLGTQSANTTDAFEERRRQAIAQGKAGTCAEAGGTCYNVVHGACPQSGANCMAYSTAC